MKYIKTCAALLIGLTVTAVGPSWTKAGPLPVDGFGLTISEAVPSTSVLAIMAAQDRPMITLTNTSTTASITSFVMNMGDQQYSFGSLIPQPFLGSPVSLTSYTPPTGVNVHAGLESMTLNFANFGPNNIFGVRADLDRNSDHGATLTNYRQVLASGGDPSKWATVDVTFSDGQTLHELITPADIAGAPQNPFYATFYCLSSWAPTGEINLGGSTPVPEPGTFLLALFGLIPSFSLIRRRRRNQTSPNSGT